MNNNSPSPSGTFARMMEMESNKKGQPVVEVNQPTSQPTEKTASKPVSKHTSKEVNLPSRKPVDPPVNKVGYYFTRGEIDDLDSIFFQLKPLFRDTYGKKVTKNDIVRACIAAGLNSWKEKKNASQLLSLLTSLLVN